MKHTYLLMSVYIYMTEENNVKNFSQRLYDINRQPKGNVYI